MYIKDFVAMRNEGEWLGALDGELASLDNQQRSTAPGNFNKDLVIALDVTSKLLGSFMNRLNKLEDYIIAFEQKM